MPKIKAFFCIGNSWGNFWSRGGGEAAPGRRPNGPALRRGGRQARASKKAQLFLRRAEQTCEPRSIAAAAPEKRAAAGPKRIKKPSSSASEKDGDYFSKQVL